MSPLIRALIDTDALRSNLRRVREAAPGARVMAIVKANGYGHGLVAVAQALPDADAFGVARLEEGLALRAAGVRAPVVLLEGVIDAEQLLAAADARFELVVHSPLQVELLERYDGAHPFVVWVKLDTGMNRLGLRVEEFEPVMVRLRALRRSAGELRLMTHLACADERDLPVTAAQLERFRETTRGLDSATSIANSAGVFAWPQARGDWVRPGLALYGVSPFDGETGASLGLRPAMSLETSVLATRRVASGESVGYGGTWRASRDTRLAVLAAGYGDGLPRSLAPGTPVLVGDVRVPLVGRVSMDMITVDVTGRPDVHVGSRAVLWGPPLPVEEIAAQAGTIPYELLCAVSQRVPLEVRWTLYP